MIEFILNDKIIKTDANKSMTLVDFIRETRGLKGTKIVCREGDCAACSVLVGEWDEDSLSVKYHTITSCISPLANANGKHIVTIEGLNLKKSLNKVQQSLKDNYASQCGFCTPGFVIALTNYCLNPEYISEQQVIDSISGNICRCTGYVSIINAAKEIVQSTLKNGHKQTLGKLSENGFIPGYFTEIPEMLREMNLQPHMVNNTQIVAGGTDLYVQKADELLTTENIRFITQEQSEPLLINDGYCSIAGTAKVSDLYFNKELSDSIPYLKNYLRLVSSEPIRNMATIAGNFVNASPIADMSVFLLALGAELLISNAKNNRTVELKRFFLDYKKVDLTEGESIAKIVFKLPHDGCTFNFEKVSKRKHLDIATVNSAICIEAEGAHIKSIDMALGGVAPVPKYLSETCDFLTGKEINNSTMNSALEIMNEEISPISDVRGSAEYKRLLANQIIKLHFMKLFPDNLILNEVI